MSHWLPRPEDITRPAYRSLARAIAAAIDAGILRPGDRLPAHRDLAWQLKLSLQTVSRAYEELIRADLIAGEVGRGTFVRMSRRDVMTVPWVRGPEVPPPIDLSMLTPVIDKPRLDAAWAGALRAMAAEMPSEASSSFRPRQTMARFGPMASDWLARCGMVVPATRILLTNGATPALSVAMVAGFVAGDEIAAEPLTHHLLGPTARIFGLKLRAVVCDDEGMRPDALEEIATRRKLRGVYLTPSGIGPRAQIMSRARRAEIAELVRRHDLFLIEADMNGPVAPRRAPPISSLVPERAWYMTTLTKCLAPGLRLGFLTLPDSHAEAALNRNLALSWMATPLIAEIAARWMADGTADDMLKFQRIELAQRNAMVERALPGRTEGFRHGLHRWVPLGHGTDEASVTEALRNEGLALAPSSRFVLGGAGVSASTIPAPGLRICLGAGDKGQLSAALRIMAEILPD